VHCAGGSGVGRARDSGPICDQGRDPLISPGRTNCPWCRVLLASPAVFDKRAGLPRTLIETPSGLVACAQRCAGPPPSGKPYLPQLVPLVALVREQRFAP